METENMVNETMNLVDTEAVSTAVEHGVNWRSIGIGGGLMVLGGLVAVGGKKLIAKLKAKVSAKKAEKSDAIDMDKEEFKMDDLDD